jgi:hypothetical protein
MDFQHLIEEVRRYRRLAATTDNLRRRRVLLALAAEFQEQADDLARDTGKQGEQADQGKNASP